MKYSLYYWRTGSIHLCACMPGSTGTCCAQNCEIHCTKLSSGEHVVQSLAHGAHAIHQRNTFAALLCWTVHGYTFHLSIKKCCCPGFTTVAALPVAIALASSADMRCMLSNSFTQLPKHVNTQTVSPPLNHTYR